MNRRCQIVLSSGLAIALTSGAITQVAAGLNPAPMASPGDSQTFAYTNGTTVDSYLVGDRVAVVKIVATGAGGGGGGDSSTGGQGGVGGSGATVTTYQSVTPGMTLKVRVGGGGGASGIAESGRGGGGSATSVSGSTVTVVAGAGGGGGAGANAGGSAQNGSAEGGTGGGSRGGIGGNSTGTTGFGGTGGGSQGGAGGTSAGQPDGSGTATSGGGGYYLSGNGGPGMSGAKAGGTSAGFARTLPTIGGGGASYGGGGAGTTGGGGGGGGYGGGGGGGLGQSGATGGGGGAGGSFATVSASTYPSTVFGVANNGGSTFGSPGADGSVVITVVELTPIVTPGKPGNFREVGGPNANTFTFHWDKSANATDATRYTFSIQEPGTRGRILVKRTTSGTSTVVMRSQLASQSASLRAYVFATTSPKKSPTAGISFEFNSAPGKPPAFREVGGPTARVFTFHWHTSARATAATRYILAIRRSGGSQLLREQTSATFAAVTRSELLAAAQMQQQTRGDVRRKLINLEASLYATTGTQRSPSTSTRFRMLVSY